ncbi:MAG: sugar transferase [Patescibacteria group bacterium]
MKKFTLLLGDIALLYIGLLLTLWIRYGHVNQALWDQHWRPFSIIFAIWLIVFFINGLYEIRKVRNDFKFYSSLLQNLLINAAIAILFFYLRLGGVASHIRPQTILVILICVFAVLFLSWRRIFYQLSASRSFGNNLAIVGVNPESLMLAEEIINKPQLGYQLKLIVNPDHSPLPEKFQITPIIKDISDLKNQLIKHNINTVVSINDPKYGPEVARYLFESIVLKIQYYNLVDFYEKITGKIPLVSLERNWFLENITQQNNRWFPMAKRLIDIFFSCVFGIISLPFLLLLILFIKLESAGPAIYKQQRVGLNNKIFTVYKLRSMRKDAENNGAVWASKNDERITRMGKFMRRTRLDEIPQFWNILMGNMSFVGPRPERPEFVEQLKTAMPFYNERHLVKPGLTGWAQINYPYGASVEDAREKLQYDLFYIKNQSIVLDISIILKTINTMFNISFGR